MTTFAASRMRAPHIAKVERDNIPDLLKAIGTWVVWRGGPTKPNGKFDKIPCDPVSGRNVNAQNSKNWLTYEVALAAYDQGVGDGIGVVLSSEHPVTLNGTDYILVALDLDKCEGRTKEIKELGLRLGNPYVEVSPSGKGLRIFALSTKQVKGGNDGNGHELYCNRHFVTVTGWLGRGKIKDATACLVELDRGWFGLKGTPTTNEAGSELSPGELTESERNIARVRDLLSYISSDVDYETWRNIVWAILSTGWNCAEQIAQEWSMKAPHRYDEDKLQTVVKSFDPSRGITLGTLYHYAELNGGIKPVNPNCDGSTIEARAGSAPCGRLLTAEQVKALPNLPYRVKGLLPAKGVASIYGAPSSGKSFLALDLALRIAAANAAEVGHRKWFGMPVKPAPVVYVALEGRSGISKRIKAWEKYHEQSASVQTRFLLGNFGLVDQKDVVELSREILATVGQNAVVFVDTLNQSAPGADENSAADMGRILANAKDLADRMEGLVILVHHAGKDRSKGMRGHSSLIAAMDAAVEVTNSNSARSWAVVKSRDDEDGLSYDFELVPYIVGQDEDGYEITSCAIRQTLHAPQTRAKPLKGKRQLAAMAKLNGLLQGNPTGVSYQNAIQEVAAALACPKGRALSAAKETIDNLIRSGHLVLGEGGIRTYDSNYKNPSDTEPP